MATARSKDIREYVLESDRELPESEQTRFFIRPLSAREQARLDDKTKFSDQQITITIDDKERKINAVDNLNEVMLERVILGLTGWANFKYATGMDCVFSQTDKEGNLDHLERGQLLELSKEISEVSKLTEAEEKN